MRPLSSTVSTAPVHAARPPAAPSTFHRTLREFLADLSAPVRRFWLAVLLTGAAAGLGAVLLVELLHIVESLCWSTGGLNEAAQSAAPLMRRLIVPLGAGVLVYAIAYLMRQPLSGHGT